MPLDGAKADEIVAKFPYLVKDAIPAKTYKGQENAVPTLSVQAILVANKNMPDDVAYALTKTLFENLGDVQGPTTRARKSLCSMRLTA